MINILTLILKFSKSNEKIIISIEPDLNKENIESMTIISVKNESLIIK